jgi:predicted kinase
MKEIIVTYGVPGSGKDYWAKELMRKYPKKYKRINKDDLRQMFEFTEFSFENEKFVIDARDALVKKSLSRGYSVIVSDTNFPFEGKHYKRMCEIAQSIGDVSVIQKFMDVPLKVCKERNAERSRVVPEEVIDRMYTKHVVNKKCDFETVYFPPVEQSYFIDTADSRQFDLEESIEYITNFKTPCIIVDMDGTLSKMNGRNAYDFSKVLDDKLNNNLKNILHSLKEYFKILSVKLIVVSGRDDSCMEDTKLWLTSNNVEFDDIFMRKTGDTRKDSVVKEEIYNNNIKGKYKVLAVFDDRDQVVEMWRRVGLFTLQVAEGDF